MATRVYGPASQAALVAALAEAAALTPGDATIASFADGERWVELHDDLAGQAAVLVASTGPPVDSHLIALAFMADAARRAGASPIVAVVPYFGYGRSDRLEHPGQALGVGVAATLLQAAGVTHLLTVDWHNPAVVGCFRIPVLEVVTSELFAARFPGVRPERQVVVSPDAGGIKRASALAMRLGLPLAGALKHRAGPDAPKVLQLWGEVAGREAIVVDDMATTAGTLVQVVERLRQAGATAVDAVITHAVMAPGAEERLRALGLRRLLLTDTLPFTPAASWPGLEVVSVVSLLAEALGGCLAGPAAPAPQPPPGV